MRKIISVLISAALFTGCLFSGCGTNSSSKSSESASDTEITTEKTTEAETEQPITVPDKPTAQISENVKAVASTDKYRNYYQIFTQSYCDSNNDGVGDFKGIISQLDYINDGNPEGGNDLGADGLWLTPINPSESYHKYSVEDYYNVDKDFGTLDDFDQLISECHKRGINIIIDLVLNHISYKNPLFLNACEEVKKGKLDGDARYFEFHEKGYYSSDVNVVEVGNYVCEANFSPTMPEWNLTSKQTREEFTKIAKFWLDRGVDGFRLDAVKYFNNKHTDGKEFLKWFVETCRGINGNAYIVGEDWDSDSEIKGFYESSIDSLFAFRFATASGEIVQSMGTNDGSGLATKFANYEKKMSAVNPDYINAMFLSNHDQVRIANSLEGNGIEAEKLAANIYLLNPGNSFTYYGEEIGMKAEKSDADEWYRMPMVFDSDNPQKIRVNNKSAYISPTGGGVKQQLADKDSLLNHYRSVINYKLKYPAISRGRITGAQDFNDKKICAYVIEYQGKKLLVIHNFDKDKAKLLDVESDVLANAGLSVAFTGKPDDIVMFENGQLYIPPYSSVVLESTK
ncbi:MAG: alpha-amylase family glycosyl hydrolase [Ruminococcus sp.]|nr:alpha-amylase family glycosyl hydrolase [Ruminococcus sp.]